MKKINPADLFCQKCGFPLKGSEEEQNNFIYQRGYKKMQVNELSDKASRASITFYIIAGIMMLSGLVSFFINAQDNESVPDLIILYNHRCYVFFFWVFGQIKNLLLQLFVAWYCM